MLYPPKPSLCTKVLFYIPENRPNFPTSKGFTRKISMNLLYQYNTTFLNFSPTSSHLYQLQVENSDEYDNGKFSIEREDS